MKNILDEFTKSTIKQSASRSTYTVTKFAEGISFDSNIICTSTGDHMKSYGNKDN